MQIIEAALAFGITMLVLSLMCSSFVEIVHRVLSMREAGLKYMLGQMFDQVLAKYLKDDNLAKLAGSLKVPGGVPADPNELLKLARESFVERMSANRAPMGATPKIAPAEEQVDKKQADEKKADEKKADSWSKVSRLWGRSHLWNGRDLAAMTPAEFMERLGSINVGDEIRNAVTAGGTTAANAFDTVLTDIAQKFEAFGKEAGVYFEGRARLLSVCVAIVLALVVRVDAIELFNTYLRDPNARNKVIEQTQAATAQFKAAQDAANTLQKAAGDNPASDDLKRQIEALQKDMQSTIESTRSTVKQYADLGLPIGWTKENATLNPWAKTCSGNGAVRVLADGDACRQGEKPDTFGCWRVLKLIGSLLLGGLLIGLGAPFWYSAVTGLTNIRGIAKDASGGGKKVADPNAVTLAIGAPATPDRPQPDTPVGAFNVAQAATAAVPT